MKREFTAVIKQDEGWWIGWVEEIPGVNSQGKTKAELLRNLKSAIKEAWSSTGPRRGPLPRVITRKR